MTYTVILFITRNSNLTTDEFKAHYEHTHIPLARTLVGGAWPKIFRRQYLARITRKGFGGPANPDRPLLMLRGDKLDDDYDCIAELSFDSELDFQLFYRGIYAKENAAILARDEEKFLEPGKTRVVVVGETVTDQGGYTTHDVGFTPKFESPEREMSTSGLS
ncbi:hypothetical protein T440DRAFT_420165 [Plenodomus tracheiphilus IPT5]|uniref:EthD domain-containing protein n=1 Tax=Plenodomus tracheiphilus IPT5 TaxID=1408161 RepID=A0A6A7BEU3_9PLEO|nr:hypothetical protein T440DRAFT_420165 [Plenodomus tracheiphilus IPT5]